MFAHYVLGAWVLTKPERYLLCTCIVLTDHECSGQKVQSFAEIKVNVDDFMALLWKTKIAQIENEQFSKIRQNDGHSGGRDIPSKL